MHYVRNKRFLDSVYQKLINERRDIDSQLHRHKEKAVGIGEFSRFKPYEISCIQLKKIQARYSCLIFQNFIIFG